MAEVSIEKMKIKAELLRVQAAKAELEYVVAQRMEEIKRIEDSIKKQEETEASLSEKMRSL